jgi:hypothetical protein
MSKKKLAGIIVACTIAIIVVVVIAHLLLTPEETAFHSIIISVVSNTNVTETTATITWTTNELVTSQVEYGLTAAYGSSTILDHNLVINHSVTITGLSPNTTYHYRVKSKDASGNEAASSDLLLVMPEPTPLVANYYRLRIEYSCSSDWATLQFLTPERILTSRLIAVNGSLQTAIATPEHFEIYRPLEQLAIEPVVSMTVDLALAPTDLEQPFYVVSRHGGIGGSGIHISYLDGTEVKFLQYIDHYWSDPDNPGYNDAQFSIDLTKFLTITPTSRQIKRIAPSQMLWAIYYPWIGWNQSAGCTDHPLIPGYSHTDQSYGFLDDPTAIAWQIDQARSAGIDGFMVSWCGCENVGELNHRLSLILDVAQERDFRIAIYLETTPDPSDLSVNPDIVRDWIAYAISTFGSHPAYMKVDGRPLIVVYNSNLAPISIWKDMFAELRANGYEASYLAMSRDPEDLTVFDGLHTYAIFDVNELASTNAVIGSAAHYYSLFDDEPKQKIWAATVLPGFDNCPYSPTSALVVERDNGAYYRSTFDAALKSDPDWIIIMTWNEFGENTHIAPSERYGNQYLEITKEYEGKWQDGVKASGK